MASERKVVEVEAARGERMIELRIRLWTNDIAESDGAIVPKHAWTAGVVRVKPNASHGITAIDPVPFNSLLDLPAAIEQVIMTAGIQLHASRRMREYMPPRDQGGRR